MFRERGITWPQSSPATHGKFIRRAERLPAPSGSGHRVNFESARSFRQHAAHIHPHGFSRSACMKTLENIVNKNGKVGYALLWLLGVPLPILLIVYLVRGH